MLYCNRIPKKKAGKIYENTTRSIRLRLIISKYISGSTIPRSKLAARPRKGQQKGFPVDLRAQWFYQLKCQGISCMARLLERCLPIGHPRLAPEQGQLEYYHSRWQHTG